MNEALVVILIIAAVGIAIGTILIVRRQLWKKRIRELGWAFESSPSLAPVLPLANPPFDCGFERKTDDLITGTTSTGRPFAVFDYRYEGAGGSDRRMALIKLPLPLPQLYLTAVGPRGGVTAPPVDTGAGLPFQVLAADPAYARVAVNSGVAGAVSALAQPGGDDDPRAIDLSVDGDNLVASDAPKDPDQLRGYLDRLDAVAAAFDPAALSPYRIEPKVPRLGFHGQDWTLVGVDDSLISRFDGFKPFGQGHGRRTDKVITGTARGTVPLTAFLYHWQTTHTRTVPDGKGGSRTETYTQNHQQPILALTLPSPTPSLTIGADSMLGRLFGGGTIDFESSQFNQVFDVTSSHPKFAHDVVHPRMMEFLLRARPPQLIMARGMLITYPAVHDTLEITRLADLLSAFLSRIPGFVWNDLGVTPPVPEPSS
ncbi:hypothetical protein [Microlunatus speluncae]|uniref:hypothetical protein n=1 Tax=Microlunatus speluncae TaxID=2594267 RepID=UPI0012663D05|nr:hypothetical protein [Microlunatus speluncae]